MDDLKRKLSDLLDKDLLEVNSGSKRISRQSVQTRAPQMLYSSLITYSSTSIAQRLADNSP